MRIAVVTPRTHHHVHTRPTARLAGFIAGLGRRGHEVSIVTPRWWGQRSHTHHGRWTTHLAGGEHTLSRVAVFRRLRQLDAEVIHLVDVDPAIVRVAGLIGRLRRIPVIYEATGFETPITDDGFLTRRASRGIDRIIAPSGVIETSLLESGLEAPIDRIPDPIDIDRIQGTVPDTRADIIWAGQGAGVSEVELVLLGLAELRDRSWQAVLLGPIEEPNEVRAAVDDLGLAGRITVLEEIKPRERIAIYRGGRVFVQTAAVCAYPTELCLAMAAGCIGVVQYQEYSSAHELIERTDRGELISTSEEIAFAITQAAKRESSTHDERFRRYQAEEVADRLLDTYRTAINADA